METCRALATDYDGTLATHGVVDEDTLAALRRFRKSGRSLIMVTGRRMEDLQRAFPQVSGFDLVVAENGAVLHWPHDGREEVLAKGPSAEFVAFLVKAGVPPLEIGRSIVATVEPYDQVVFEAIKTLGLELQVIFNKGAVMVLPTGVNKATGLKIALEKMGLRAEEVVGVGDAENDHAFLDFCGTSAAVANALPALKARAEIVLAGRHGAGVAELIDAILASSAPT
jgi:hydroxymethylpyrimidine pyrophosphatase-like HAD family hydrolase